LDSSTISATKTKQSLVYDLQEPFRWLIDLTVIQAFESGVLDLPDFYVTGDDYWFRFDAEAKQRFIDLIRERFNSGFSYKKRVLKWDTIIEQKTNELARFLIGKSSAPDFTEPVPKLERRNDRELRAKILALTASQARDLGIGKSTLHYLRGEAGKITSFRIHVRTVARLNTPKSS